jgi:hypothetical protein
MTREFFSALDAILRRSDRHLALQEPKPTPGASDPGTAIERRRQWFSKLATITIMPLFDEVAETARKHGADATSRLAEVDGRVAAELVIIRGFLPKGAQPPRLTVYATETQPPLMIEYTGTFRHVGATGGLGAEIDYDSIYPVQLEEKILDFVELACGEGTPLS